MECRMYRWAAVLVAALAARAGGQVAVLGAAADTSLIRNNSSPSLHLSSGAGEAIFCGRTFIHGDFRQRGLVRFDVSSIPACATVTGVELTLTTLNGGPTVPVANVHLHRVTEEWGEGASASLGGLGAPSQRGDADWISRVYPDIPWTTQGGTFDPTASMAAGVPNTFAVVRWASTARAVSDVQGWLASPSSNFGWIILNDESTLGSARKFASREHATVAWRPQLAVTYSLPGPPTVAGQPLDARVCGGEAATGTGAASFTVTGSGPPPLAFVWRRGQTPVNLGDPRLVVTVSPDGLSSTLTISGVTPADAAQGADGYSALVNGPCGGSVESDTAALSVCAADFTCDGFVDFLDAAGFVGAFEAGDAAADFDGDGFLDFLDFDAFVAAFEAGC